MKKKSWIRHLSHARCQDEGQGHAVLKGHVTARGWSRRSQQQQPTGGATEALRKPGLWRPRGGPGAGLARPRPWPVLAARRTRLL